MIVMKIMKCNNNNSSNNGTNNDDDKENDNNSYENWYNILYRKDKMRKKWNSAFKLSRLHENIYLTVRSSHQQSNNLTGIWQENVTDRSLSSVKKSVKKSFV